MMKNTFRLAFFIAVIVSSFAFLGCSVVGKRVPIEKRIPLVDDGVQKGEQVVNDVNINYAFWLYHMASDSNGLLEIKGKAYWKKGIPYKMWVWVDFLNSNGKILERNTLVENIKVTGGRFQKRMKIPVGTVSISFEASATRFYRSITHSPQLPQRPLPPPIEDR